MVKTLESVSPEESSYMAFVFARSCHPLRMRGEIEEAESLSRDHCTVD